MKTKQILYWITTALIALGAASGYLIRRGWPLGAARKAMVVFGGIGVLALIPQFLSSSCG